jgi:hypothetical protein
MVFFMTPVSIPGVPIRPPKSAPGAKKKKRPTPVHKPAKKKPSTKKITRKKTVKRSSKQS